MLLFYFYVFDSFIMERARLLQLYLLCPFSPFHVCLLSLNKLFQDEPLMFSAALMARSPAVVPADGNPAYEYSYPPSSSPSNGSVPARVIENPRLSCATFHLSIIAVHPSPPVERSPPRTLAPFCPLSDVSGVAHPFRGSSQSMPICPEYPIWECPADFRRYLH